MIGDIMTVLWKEGIEMLHMRGSVRSTVTTQLIPVAIFGIVFPLQFGRQWAESPVSLIAWAWIPLIFTITMIADSIAGEKERRTLETLLASRLPDRAILLGKLLISVLYALALTALILLSGLVTVNIVHHNKGFIWYNPAFLSAGLGIGLLITVFTATTGILVSLKAHTVRQAAQTMSFGIVIIAVLPGLLFTVLPPAIRKRVFAAFDSLDGGLALAAVLGVLLVIDCLLLAAAIRRFKRNRLMTD